MPKETYHHGNLREALLHCGLNMLQEHGEEKLSLRKAAKLCGVSSAAPYAHFKDKDDFLRSLLDYIMDELTFELQKVAKEQAGKKTILIELGLCYVLYFLHRPHYFSLMFSKSEHVEAVLRNDSYGLNPAFNVLKQAADPILQHFFVPESKRHHILLAMWALVHGLAVIVCTPEISERLRKDPEGKEFLRKILSAFSAPNG
jgi:AcrR family transcriptional regulator